MRLPTNGSYRVFADFTTGGERRTLGVDLAGVRRAGRRPRAALAGTTSRCTGTATGSSSVPTFGGNPVKLQRYLGAAGHLVVLREGDLAYIHAHADEDELAFDVPFPGPGRYRLYLQFQVGGKVETVAKAVTR